MILRSNDWRDQEDRGMPSVDHGIWAAEEFRGFNVDVGSVSEMAGFLRMRARKMEQAMRFLQAAGAAKAAAEKAYFGGYARAYEECKFGDPADERMPKPWATNARERYAKTVCVDLRVALMEAEKDWTIACKGVEAARSLANIEQSFAGLLKKEIDMAQSFGDR